MFLGYTIVSGGTDTHLFIVDLRAQNITGHAAEKALDKAGINVTRSCIPFDTEKPWVGSGIRLGTPAVTTRGMTTDDMHTIAGFINDAILHANDDTYLAEVRNQVTHFLRQKQNA